MSRTPSMRAARFDLRTREIVVKDVRLPRPAAGEILVRVAATGVSRTDLAVAAGLIVPHAPGRTEVTLGHQAVGTVVAPGAGVNGWPIGRRVAVHPNVHRGDAVRRLGVDFDGGWADYLVAPVANLVLIPDGVPFEHAAFLPDDVATPWSAIARTARVRPGEGIAIWGVDRMGLHAVRLARLVGAVPVIAIDAYPAAREQALAAGADAALDPAAPQVAAQLRAAGHGHWPDVALDFTGSAMARHRVTEQLAARGKVVVGPGGARQLGAGELAAIASAGQQLLGHVASSCDDLREVIRLVEFGRLDLREAVTGIQSIEAAPDVVRELLERGSDGAGVALRPQRASETG